MAHSAPSTLNALIMASSPATLEQTIKHDSGTSGTPTSSSPNMQHQGIISTLWQQWRHATLMLTHGPLDIPTSTNLTQPPAVMLSQCDPLCCCTFCCAETAMSSAVQKLSCAAHAPCSRRLYRCTCHGSSIAVHGSSCTA